MPMGYAESKYVAERLLEIAGEKGGVSAAICRVGQLAGPVKKGGMWSKQEWLPSVSVDRQTFSSQVLKEAFKAMR